MKATHDIEINPQTETQPLTVPMQEGARLVEEAQSQFKTSSVIDYIEQYVQQYPLLSAGVSVLTGSVLGLGVGYAIQRLRYGRDFDYEAMGFTSSGETSDDYGSSYGSTEYSSSGYGNKEHASGFDTQFTGAYPRGSGATSAVNEGHPEDLNAMPARQDDSDDATIYDGSETRGEIARSAP